MHMYLNKNYVKLVLEYKDLNHSDNLQVLINLKLYCSFFYLITCFTSNLTFTDFRYIQKSHHTQACKVWQLWFPWKLVSWLKL